MSVFVTFVVRFRLSDSLRTAVIRARASVPTLASFTTFAAATLPLTTR